MSKKCCKQNMVNVKLKPLMEMQINAKTAKTIDSYMCQECGKIKLYVQKDVIAPKKKMPRKKS